MYPFQHSAAANAALETYAEWGPFQPDVPGRLLERKYTNDASEFVTLGGTRVHYRDQGPADAPVLLALHGVYSSLHTWDGWVDTLDDVRVIRLDVPGFGLTGPSANREYSVSQYVAFLREFCEELGINSASVVGNSMGGTVGWRFAVRHEEVVQKLILVNAGRQQLLSPEAEILTTPGFDVVPRYATPRVSTRLILRDAYGDPAKLSADTVRRYHDLLLRAGNRRAVLTLAQNTTPAPFAPDAVSVPTLIQWGREDDWLPSALPEQFAAEIPDAELQEYPELGHVPMEEAPRKTAKDAAVFLEEIS